MTFRKKIAISSAVLTLGCSLLSSSVLAPAAYAAPEPSATPIVKEYTDGATLTFPSTWTEGEPLEFSGVNFFATDGTPLVLAVRLNGGPVGSSDYLQFETDADGKGLRPRHPAPVQPCRRRRERSGRFLPHGGLADRRGPLPRGGTGGARQLRRRHRSAHLLVTGQTQASSGTRVW